VKTCHINRFRDITHRDSSVRVFVLMYSSFGQLTAEERVAIFSHKVPGQSMSDRHESEVDVCKRDCDNSNSGG